jgi:hypothetical protein
MQATIIISALERSVIVWIARLLFIVGERVEVGWALGELEKKALTDTGREMNREKANGKRIGSEKNTMKGKR